MADFSLNNIRISLRNDLASTWESTNPVLIKGEMGVEIDTGKFKFGDGAKTWNQLNYAASSSVQVITTAPTTQDTGEIGSIAVDTTTDKVYILVDNTTNANIWKEISTDGSGGEGSSYVLPVASSTVLGGVKIGKNINVATDGTISIENVEFDNIESSSVTIGSTTSGNTTTLQDNSQIYTDADGKKIIAEFDPTNKKITYKDELDGDISIGGIKEPSSDNDAANKKYVDDTISEAVTDKQDIITGAATSIVSDNLTVDKVLISNADGKVAVSDITSTELGYLSGVTGGIQAQINNIPKYNYKDGVEISIADDSAQEAINTASQTKLGETYPSAVKYDTSVVNITFTPSNVEKDALYMYDGTEWVFLYYVSTGINRANGNVAGIVDSSDDITFVDGKGNVVQAGKVKNALTIQKNNNTVGTFDGSSATTIDLEIPTSSADLSDGSTILKSTDSFILNCGGASLNA